MQIKIKRSLILNFALVSAVVLIFALIQFKSIEDFSIGRKADAFEAQILNRDTLSRSSYSRQNTPGQSMVLLNFWASWCVACAEELPFLNKLKSHGLDVVGIATSDEVDDIYDSGKLSSRHFINLFDADGVIAQKYGIDSLPQSVLLGKNNDIIMTVQGPLNEKRYLMFLAKLEDGEGK